MTSGTFPIIDTNCLDTGVILINMLRYLLFPENVKVLPLTCHGHSRPITHLSFSSVENEQYYLISASKGTNQAFEFISLLIRIRQ